PQRSEVSRIGSLPAGDIVVRRRDAGRHGGVYSQGLPGASSLDAGGPTTTATGVVQHHLLPACSSTSLVPLLHTSRSLRRLATNEIRRRLLPLASGLTGGPDRACWSREEAFVTWHALVLELCEGCEVRRGRRQPFFEENLCTRCAVPAYFRLLPRISRSCESLDVARRMLMKLSSGKSYVTADSSRELSNAFHRFSSSAGSERAANRRAVYMAAHETEWVRHYR
ncbi:MAG: hypothetical protein BJ554DRAFT_1071, partial [Olpidium bornovanus]